jgi:hypothetical protein
MDIGCWQREIQARPAFGSLNTRKTRKRGFALRQVKTSMMVEILQRIPRWQRGRSSFSYSFSSSYSLPIKPTEEEKE